VKLADRKTIRKIDSISVRAFRMRSIQLMENAGRGVADVVRRESSHLDQLPRVSVFCGKGRNGGDGYVAARHLKNHGFSVAVFSFARTGELKGDALVNARIWENMGGDVFLIKSPKDIERHAPAIRHSRIIVDAIFGTGLSTSVGGVYAGAVGFINGLNRGKRKVIAVDIPSGIDSTTGGVLGSAVKATVTATMAMPKAGLYIYPGRSFAGRIETIDIGVPRSLLEDPSIPWNVTTEGDLRMILRPREPDSHKGTYGHAVIIGGSPGKTGAPYMAAMGALRAGAGLATIGVPAGLNPVMEEKTTEAMTWPLPETREGTLSEGSATSVMKLLQGKSVLVIGPGLGESRDMAGLIKRIIKEAALPLVVDADGLNAIRGNPGVLKKARHPAVITPHPGEASRLLGVSAKDVQADRIESAVRLSKMTRSTVVLKGASTVIAGPDGAVYVNPTGNPGLATAGTGDVLSGMIGGLIAEGYRPLEASIAAVYIHGLAADSVKRRSGEIGLIATDILPLIPGLLNPFTAPSA